MPFGLSNTPAVFQNLVNDVLRDFLHKFGFIYLDDLLIFSRNLEKHKTHVCLVLQRLLENRLYVKAKKCEFHILSTIFLSFVLEGRQVRADPTKTQDIKDWPTPDRIKQLQHFLGIANFYWRFIKNFSQIAIPLTTLTSTKRHFQWTPEANQEFRQLKELFVQAPILTQPDLFRQFILEVNASD